MSIRKRQGNDVKRRFEPAGHHNSLELAALASRVTYVGSANHKLRPGNYRFHPASNPRATKDVCDDKRRLLIEEAQELFRAGILAGMVSAFESDGVPKYVWIVDADGEVYEAKAKAEREAVYHGYRLSDDDSAMRDLVRSEWKKRCL